MRAYLLTTTAVMALLSASIGSTRAQTNWTGAQSTDWFTAGNWTAGVPTGVTNAIIDTVSKPTVVGTHTPGGTAQNLTVGQSGSGNLTIQDGGTVSMSIGPLVGLGAIGNGPGSQGTVTVTGAGSTWTNGNVVVGGLGTGTLIIQNGGTVNNAGGGSVGLSVGSTGTVTVTGASSSFNNTLGLNIGSFGTGTLTIADGGIVTPGGPFRVASNAGSIGTLNIGAGASNSAAAPGTLTAPSVAFGAGTGTLNFNHTSTNYVFSPAISGNGSVNVLAGATTLTANNTYTGATTVNGGP
jgi:T5SS/PEP-CTERM-associated repeat protein